jgi:hypothetical protein
VPLLTNNQYRLPLSSAKHSAYNDIQWLSKRTSKGTHCLGPFLPSARPTGTRQRLPLCRVPPKAFGKGTDKRGPVEPPLLSARLADTQQRLPLCRMSRAHSAKSRLRRLSLWRRLFFAKHQVALGNDFFECPTKSTRQRSRCRYIVHRDHFVKSHTRQRLCWSTQQTLVEKSSKHAVGFNFYKRFSVIKRQCYF